MKAMEKTVAAMICMGALSGCVEIHQVVYMEHDGSGRITEKIRVLPRAVRLLKGHKIRGGEGPEAFELLSEATTRERLKAAGELTLKSQKVITLADGSLQLNVEYTYRDINKVNLWMMPTFKCNDPSRSGKLNLEYQRIIRGPNRSEKYYKADMTTVKTGGVAGRKRYSSPAILKSFEHITPIYQDMLSDFKIKLEAVAPIEDFEENDMVRNLPYQKNRVTLLNIQGRNVSGAGEIIKQFLAGEVGGRADAWGGTWKKMEDPLPGTFTPYGKGYGRMAFRFLKLAEVPKSGGKKKPEPEK